MFPLKFRLLGSKTGTAKNGNSYRLAMIRVGEGDVMNVRVGVGCQDLLPFHDKEITGNFKLGAYNLNPNISLVEISK